MKVLNIHERIIPKPIEDVSILLDTLSTKEDKVWPWEKWPRMKFRDGLKLGARGGHGLIKYTIVKYQPKELIEFEFTSPKGLNGVHRLEIIKQDEDSTNLIHTIDIQTNGTGTLKWLVGIRALHDALIEDAFDKVESHFSGQKAKRTYSVWVRILRSLLR